MRLFARRSAATLIMIVAITLTALPQAHATAPVGAGSLAGTWLYDSPFPLPWQPCIHATSSIDAVSLTASIGTLTVRGSADSGVSCESALLGGGTVTLSVDFVARDSTAYDCPNASGTYTRTAKAGALITTGQCTVNAYGFANVTLTMTATLVPDTPYGWFVGTFTFVAQGS